MTGSKVSETDVDEMVATVRELIAREKTADVGGVPTRYVAREVDWSPKCINKHLTADDRVGMTIGVDYSVGSLKTWFPVEVRQTETPEQETDTDERLIADGGRQEWHCRECGEDYGRHARAGNGLCVWCDADTTPRLVTDGGLVEVAVEIVRPASTTTIQYADREHAEATLARPVAVLTAVGNAVDRFAMPMDVNVETVATLHVLDDGTISHVDFEERYVESRDTWVQNADTEYVIDASRPDDRLVTDGGVTAADCPNCYTDDDSETDCPHLLAGDDCPNCGRELQKPRGGKVECPTCRYVVNGQNTDQELRDFELTFRQASRVLTLFGYDRPATPGNAGNKLRRFCHDHEFDREDLNDILADIRQAGRYDDERDLVTDGGMDTRPRSWEPAAFEFSPDTYHEDVDGRVWRVTERLFSLDESWQSNQQYVIERPDYGTISTESRRIPEEDLVVHFVEVDEAAHKAYVDEQREQWETERRRDESEYRGIGHPVETRDDLVEHFDRCAEVAEHLIDEVGRPAWVDTDVRVRPWGGADDE